MDGFQALFVAFYFVCAVVMFAAPYLWRRGVVARLPASITRSWPRTPVGATMIGCGAVTMGAAFLFLGPMPSLTFFLVMLVGAILAVAGRVVEGALA